MTPKAPQVLVDVRGRLGVYAPAMQESAVAVSGRMAQELGLGSQHELSLLLTDNSTIRRINRRWRDIDRPTDVLSFPLHTLKPGQSVPAGPVGDIVISLPYTRLAARQEGISLEYHLAHLLVHGLLHLLGYDHERDADARRMEREEKRLLTKEFPQ